jgi:hypothetical protein
VYALEITETERVVQQAQAIIAREGFSPAEFAVQVLARDEPGASGGPWFVVHVRRSGTRFAAQYSTGSELWTRLLADQLRRGYFSARNAPPPVRGRCR